MWKHYKVISALSYMQYQMDMAILSMPVLYQNPPSLSCVSHANEGIGPHITKGPSVSISRKQLY